MNEVAEITISHAEAIGFDLGQLLPEGIVAASFLMGMTVQIFRRKKWPALTPILVVLGFVLALASSCFVTPPDSGPYFGGMIIQPQPFVLVFRWPILLVSALVVGLTMYDNELGLRRRKGGEYYLLVSLMALGMLLMLHAHHLFMVYLATEMVSLPAYALVAWTRGRRNSAEAGMKYVIYGAFSSAIMLFGISYLLSNGYVLSQLVGIRFHDDPLALWGMILFLGGFAFKIAAAPFHFYVPDVYEGAPWPITLLLSTAPKLAGVVVLLQVVGVSYLPYYGHPPYSAYSAGIVAVIVAFISIASMLVGTLGALRQRNFRRMLAWSSVAQTGYILMGLATLTPEGLVATAFYALMYVPMTLGAFLIAWWLARHTGSEEMDSYRGLATSQPGLMVFLTLMMAALVGLPPTVGFMAKLQVFSSVIAWDGPFFLPSLPLVMVVVAVLTSVVSLAYYMRVPLLMAFRNPLLKTRFRLHTLEWVLLILLAIPVLLLGLFFFPNIMAILQAGLR